MTKQEDQALAVITEILARLTRIETKLSKFMAERGVEPSAKDGYGKPDHPKYDHQRPVRYWEG